MSIKFTEQTPYYPAIYNFSFRTCFHFAPLQSISSQKLPPLTPASGPCARGLCHLHLETGSLLSWLKRKQANKQKSLLEPHLCFLTSPYSSASLHGKGFVITITITASSLCVASFRLEFELLSSLSHWGPHWSRWPVLSALLQSSDGSCVLNLRDGDRTF